MTARHAGAGALLAILAVVAAYVCRALEGVSAHRHAQAASVLHYAGLLEEGDA